jgi:hypothetical protein
MTSEEIQQKINELESVRSETRLWRWGASIAITIGVVWCVWSLGSSVRNLFVPGPVQDQFGSTLAAGLKRDVLPDVQSIATQALTESKPQIEVSFAQLNGKVPELTSTTMKQFDLLQTNIPQIGDKVLSASYGTMLTAKEAKLKEMFPEATDANISALVTNMTAEGTQQILASNKTLFSKHMAAMNGIETDLTKIQATEVVSPDQDKANWEMALLVVDGFHDDLSSLKAADAKSSTKAVRETKND